jgi:prophage antirepressor
MKASSGKKRKILAGNIKDIFRIIQSIPSPKAEPFKLERNLRMLGTIMESQKA